MKKGKDKDDIETINRGLLTPSHDLLSRGGKQWRPCLGLIFAKMLDHDIQDFEKSKSIYFVQGLTELVHNGSLIIDDIEDSSQSRRGQPCVHLKFGEDTAINAGNFLYFAPWAHH